MQKAKILAGAILGACIAGLSGCASTGGDIGGLVPAPKFLKGSIDNNVYTAQDKRFTVAVPHAQGSYEYTYMKVKEQYNPLDDYVSFGPAAFDQDIYRVDVAFRATPGSMVPSFGDTAPKMLAEFQKQGEQAYNAPFSPLSDEMTQVNGHTARHWQFKQDVPSGTLANVPVTLHHDIYTIDYGYALATVWVQEESGVSSGETQALTPAAFAASVKPLPEPGNGAQDMAADGTFHFPKQPVTIKSPVVLCGSATTSVFESDNSVDFTGPDQLWQLAGDYAVQVFPTPQDAASREGFMARSRKYMEGYVAGDRKPLGATPKVTATKEMQVNGLPAYQALGLEEGKDFLYATAILGKSHVMLVSLLAPLRAGEDPAALPATECYNKFLDSIRETD